MTAAAVLEVEGATKSFGAVAALSDVSLRLGRGEVLAVVGDNGAGKSTLIKCVSGAHRLDRGLVRVDGELVALRSPVHADSTASRPSTRTSSTTSASSPTCSPGAS